MTHGNHFDDNVGRCKEVCNRFLACRYAACIFSGVVFTHRYVYTDRVAPNDVGLFVGKGGEAERDTHLHEAYRSGFGAVVRIVLARAE